MATTEVNVQELLFTQSSIKCNFKKPRQDDRIDDAVDLLLQGKIKTTDFPKLQVVLHEGRLWSLDNRRLWIFKKAKVSTVTVKIIPYHSHPRFAECMNNLQLKAKLERSSFWPRVRGECRKRFIVPGGGRPRPGVPSSSAATDQSLMSAKRAHLSLPLPLPPPPPVPPLVATNSPIINVPKEPAFKYGQTEIVKSWSRRPVVRPEEAAQQKVGHAQEADDRSIPVRGAENLNSEKSLRALRLSSQSPSGQAVQPADDEYIKSSGIRRPDQYVINIPDYVPHRCSADGFADSIAFGKLYCVALLFLIMIVYLLILCF